jgi:hypothetical protein
LLIDNVISFERPFQIPSDRQKKRPFLAKFLFQMLKDLV